MVLTYKDEISNETETSLDDKKITCGKCLIHIISLVIQCLLLLAIVCITCHYYYAKHWIKKEYTLP